MSIKSVMPSNHLILCHPSPPACNLPQHQGLFQWVRSSHQVAKLLEFQLQHQSFQWIFRVDFLYWFDLLAVQWTRVFSSTTVQKHQFFSVLSLLYSISPSNKYSGLISFRFDWLDLRAVQGTLKSLLQHYSSKGSILRCSAFFIVQLSHPYMTTGKTIALTRQTFVGKIMSLLLNMLSRLVITFLPRSKRLLISWLQSPSAVILEPQKVKSATVSTVSPSICHEVTGLIRWFSFFECWVLSQLFHSPFTFIKRLFSSLLSAIGWCHLHIWGYWYFSRQSWFQLVLHPAQHFSWWTLHVK